MTIEMHPAHPCIHVPCKCPVPQGQNAVRTTAIMTLSKASKQRDAVVVTALVIPPRRWVMKRLLMRAVDLSGARLANRP